MEAFPNNPHTSDKIVLLGQHYEKTLRTLGHDSESLPHSLFFTFCGDILGSSGEHYKKGHPVNFFETTERAALNFSDDYMESLAMYLMKDEKIQRDTKDLIRVKKIFFDLIANHFEVLCQTYSPWFGAIRDATTPERFIEVTMQHGSCGTAMRAAVLAATQTDDNQALNLFLITHAHTEALEGGFWVKGYAEAAMDKQNFEVCLQRAMQKSEEARSMARQYHQSIGHTPQKFPPLNSFVEKTLQHNDPYASINDIAEEGIETRFVVSAVAYILSLIHDEKNASESIQTLATKSLQIGGDPDTICSIAMSLYGLRWPEESIQFLNDVQVGIEQPSL